MPTPLRLIVRHPDGSREEHALSDGVWTIGRARDNRIAPLDAAMSRYHAVLHVRGGHVALEALPSRNPPRVAGEPVEGRRELAAGDEVRLGRTRLTVEVVAGEGSGGVRHQPTVELAAAGAGPALIAVSPAMRRVVDTVVRFAPSRLPVLITGASGTGKELVAHALHERSPWADGPFVVVNCPALPGSLVEAELFGVEAGVATEVRARTGRLEAAERGTLFLDEVGDLAPAAQAKLLRFLEDGSLERIGGREVRRVATRVVAATNRDIEAEIAAGRFRQDLYFRLAALKVALPPLAERPEDVLPLAEHFLAVASGGRLTLGGTARSALARRPFPGNVRELKSVIERAALLCDRAVIEAADLDQPGPEPVGTTAAPSPADLLEALVERRADFWDAVWEPFQRRELPRATVRALVAAGLARSGGSVRRLAELLHTPDRYRKLLDFLRNNDLLP